MCARCDEIDARTGHYAQIKVVMTDLMTRDGIDNLVKKLKAEKAALHPKSHDKSVG
jgi:hypothetical protein